MKLVVDASVAVKWFLKMRPAEAYISKAAAVGASIEAGGAMLYAPPHWVIEVISVLAREEPQLVEPALILFDELNPEIVQGQDILRHAAELAAALDHHLFDTLYHATAIACDATLVTADDRYFAKAARHGHIVRLSEFQAA